MSKAPLSASLGDDPYWQEAVKTITTKKAKCPHFHVKRDSATYPDFECLECGESFPPQVVYNKSY
jgi:hypothetical protein